MKNNRHNNVQLSTCLKYRSGFTIFESLISMILVSATVTISIPALRVVNLQRKSVNERLTATTALANLGERIAAENSWGSLSPQNIAQYQSKILTQLDLKKSRLTVKLIENENAPTVRQVQIQLSWENPYGESVDPLFLSLWFYGEESANE